MKTAKYHEHTIFEAPVAFAGTGKPLYGIMGPVVNKPAGMRPFVTSVRQAQQLIADAEMQHNYAEFI